MNRNHGGKRLAHPGGIVDFSSNVCHLGPPRAALEAVRAATAETVASYPDPDYPVLRAALSSYAGRPVEEIFPANGSAELFYLACNLLRPRRTLIISPSFCEYALAARSSRSAVEEHLLLEGDGYALEPGRLASQAREADLVFLCNPNSPTGVSHPIESVLAIARELKMGAVLLVDEAFIEFCDSPLERTASRRPVDKIWVSRSLTKYFGLAGLRAGYLLAPRAAVRDLEDSAPPWRINSLAEAAVVAALGDSEYVTRTTALVAEARVTFIDMLERLGFLKVYPSEANFLLVRIQRPGLTSSELSRKLLRQGFLVRDASTFSGLDERYLRLAVRSTEDNLALVRALEELEK